MDVSLRELRRADLPAVNRWRNDAEVVRHLGANFLFISPEVDDRWFDAYLAGRDRAIRLAIAEAGTDRLLGVVYLTDLHRINRSAELGIMVGEKDAWSRGVGTAATRTVLAHGFDDLNLHRVYLSVLAENTRAVRLYKKLGFSTEGVQREAVFKQGRYQDIVLMGLLREQYLSRGADREAAQAAGGSA